MKLKGGWYIGLLFFGFSVEYLGLNDYYYWDDFWGIVGLKVIVVMYECCGDIECVVYYMYEVSVFWDDVSKSLVVILLSVSYLGMLVLFYW